MALDGRALDGAIGGMDERLEAFPRVLEFARGVPQEFLEARAEPGFVAGNIEFPDAVAGAAHGARQALFHRIQGRFGALQVGDVDQRTGDAGEFAVAVMGAAGGFRDPAFGAVRQQHAVLAAVGRILRRGAGCRAADTRDVPRMHGRETPVEVVERGGRGDAQDLVEVRGRQPALAAEVQVHGGDAGHRLRDIERLRGVAQRRLEFFAIGDVGDGADDARRKAFGVHQHSAAAIQPAQSAVEQQRTIFGRERAARGDGVVQFPNHSFEVFGVDGDQPLIAREQRHRIVQARQLEEHRRAGHLAGDEIQVEDAEAARRLREFQQLGRAAQTPFAFAALENSHVQAVRQQLEFIARDLVGGRRRAALEQARQRFAQRADAFRQRIGFEPRRAQEREHGGAQAGAKRDVIVEQGLRGLIERLRRGGLGRAQNVGVAGGCCRQRIDGRCDRGAHRLLVVPDRFVQRERRRREQHGSHHREEE